MVVLSNGAARHFRPLILVNPLTSYVELFHRILYATPAQQGFNDVTFQKRSLARMWSFEERGKTVALMSHDLGAVRSLCDRAIVLDHGRITFDGEVEQALTFSSRLIHASAGFGPTAVAPAHADPNGHGGARISEFRFDVPGHDLVGRGLLAVGIALRRPDLSSAVYETRYVAPSPAVCLAAGDVRLRAQRLDRHRSRRCPARQRRDRQGGPRAPPQRAGGRGAWRTLRGGDCPAVRT
ncbi:MAG: hypothetical protein ACRDZ4_03660 [Egibacteraceae bacterium]